MLTYTRASGDTNRLIGQQDESVRLWNIRTGVMVLIFAGARGHRNEVLSVDFHPTERWKFVSCGMDNTIKIWAFAGEQEGVQRGSRGGPEGVQRGPVSCGMDNTIKIWAFAGEKEGIQRGSRG
eukprot:905692-Prorocentrum_minimum.AAC.9